MTKEAEFRDATRRLLAAARAEDLVSLRSALDERRRLLSRGVVATQSDFMAGHEAEALLRVTMQKLAAGYIRAEKVRASMDALRPTQSRSRLNWAA